MGEAIEELEEMALEWAVQNVMEGEEFSLVGAARDTEGEITALMVFAKDDQEMFAKASGQMRQVGTTAFCMIGTVTMVSRTGSLQAFVRYAQSPSDGRVRCAVAPYAIEGEGEERHLALAEWHERAPLSTSWLPATTPRPTDSPAKTSRWSSFWKRGGS